MKDSTVSKKNIGDIFKDVASANRAQKKLLVSTVGYAEKMEERNSALQNEVDSLKERNQSLENVAETRRQKIKQLEKKNSDLAKDNKNLVNVAKDISFKLNATLDKR